MDFVVVRSGSRPRSQELWAVLDAAGIPARIAGERGSYTLVVQVEDRERALRELDDYLSEDRPRRPDPPLRTLEGGWTGVLAYAFVILSVAYLAQRHALDADWFERGRAQAGLMIGGEWWRSVTALTLHVDGRHLLGNLLFGSVLGFLAAQGLGGGGAWLAIVVGGTLGNGVNAALQDPAHSAVGASTAVFAALGVLVALALRYNRKRDVSAARRWSPLVAGLLLLGWTGMGGERTDVWAHVAGLATGMLVGAACGFAPPAWLARRGVQWLAWSLTALIVLGAWGWALG